MSEFLQVGPPKSRVAIVIVQGVVDLTRSCFPSRGDELIFRVTQHPKSEFGNFAFQRWLKWVRKRATGGRWNQWLRDEI